MRDFPKYEPPSGGPPEATRSAGGASLILGISYYFLSKLLTKARGMFILRNTISRYVN
jgi:hypothetical protein